MTDDTFLAERLDAAIGDGPPPPPVHTYVHTGRRALLRRRIATGASALAVLVAVGGVGLAVTDPAGDAVSERGFQPADQGDPDGVVREAADHKPAVRITDGELHVAGDIELVTVTPNPLGLEAPAASFGVDWVRDGVSHWQVHYSDGEESGAVGGTITSRVRREVATYDEFLAAVTKRWEFDQLATGRANPPTNPELQELELVELGPDETLTPVDDATLVFEQTNEFDLPDNFALEGDPAAAALVFRDGFPIFVLARQLEGSAPEYIHYVADGETGYDLEGFLDFARTQYGNEEGLR